jgi:hypothetical protein
VGIVEEGDEHPAIRASPELVLHGDRHADNRGPGGGGNDDGLVLDLVNDAHPRQVLISS